MCAFGLPVARYRYDGNLLLRSHGGERVAIPDGDCVNCALRTDVAGFLTGVPGGRLLLMLPETADPLDIALAADAAGVTVETVAMIANLGSVARIWPATKPWPNAAWRPARPAAVCLPGYWHARPRQPMPSSPGRRRTAIRLRHGPAATCVTSVFPA